MTVDTACSGGLTSVDLACRYLAANDISAAVVAASHLFLKYVPCYSIVPNTDEIQS
jgi:acyl transferase domain-containing protein